MSRISTNLTLSALKNAAIIKHGKNGDVDCLLIPIEQNKLYFNKEKGIVSLSTIGFPFENKRENSKDTHIVKQSFDKDYFASLSEEQKRDLPILGNHVLWSDSTNEPQGGGAKVTTDISDLPF